MAYKLLTKVEESDEFRSLTKLTFQGGVIYKIGKPTHPFEENGPLAAFISLEAVAKFQVRHGWKKAALFRCKVKKEKGATSLWIHYTGGYTNSLYKLPYGTVLCKEITLTKRLY